MNSSISTKLKVGLTTLVGLTLLFVGVLWVKEYNPMKKRAAITVEFTDAKGITGGDPVAISGIKVGVVTTVDLSDKNTALVKFTINSQIRLFCDCTFEIQDVGLMGDKMLVIVPGSLEPEIDTGIVQKGIESSSLTDLMIGAGEILEKLNSISTKIDNDLDLKTFTESYEQTFRKVREAVSIYEDIARENRKPLNSSITALEASADDLETFVEDNSGKFGDALESFQRTSEKLSMALDNLDNLATVVDTLSAYIESGEGTLGKLVKSDDLYEELRRTNANIDSFLVDFKKNPGKYTKDMQFKLRLF